MELLEEEERKEPLNQNLLFFEPIMYSHVWLVQELSPDQSELQEMVKVNLICITFLSTNCFKAAFQAIQANWKDT